MFSETVSLVRFARRRINILLPHGLIRLISVIRVLNHFAPRLSIWCCFLCVSFMMAFTSRMGFFRFFLDVLQKTPQGGFLSYCFKRYQARLKAAIKRAQRKFFQFAEREQARHEVSTKLGAID